MAADRPPPALEGRAIRLRLLGPLSVCRAEVELPLPASRKVRALIAYLALAPRPSTRTRLCEILGDIPNDPRGELRWCLSKVRAVLDEPRRRRVVTVDDAVRLDLDDAFVDVLEIDRAMQAGIASLSSERLRSISTLFVGDFMDGLTLERSPHFNGWLLAQRRRWHACELVVLENLVERLSSDSDESFGWLERWLQLAPFDRRAHQMLFQAFARRAQFREGDDHLAAVAHAFDAEGLDIRPIRDAWREARLRAMSASDAAQPTGAVAASPPTSSSLVLEGQALSQRRASIAVMPLVDQLSSGTGGGGLADGLAHDIITRLAKLRSLFVIAQGTVFALHDRCVGAEEAGRTLDVDFIVGGSVRCQGGRIAVNVALTETRTARVVWAEAFDHKVDDAFLVLDEIGNRIVASIASEIEAVERNRAILKPPNSLDAWEAYHRGLWHMYRFNRGDNERALHFFELAVRLDPGFARAYSGLSFAHFQSAFQHWSERRLAVDRAFDTARQSIAVDDRDPAAHWAMGRALWLRGEQVESLVELETAVRFSPNFALGHYTLAFVQSQSGDPQAAIDASDHSRHLSPYDPLLFGMLGTRAMALVRLGRFEEAAEWALKAAARPHAHAHILSIAVHCLALANRLEDARRFAGAIHATLPSYRSGEFLASFRFSEEAEALFRAAAKRIDFD